MDKMFCYQCEQTSRGEACVLSGACGKIPDVAELQDELTSALIALSRSVLSASNLPDHSEEATPGADAVSLLLRGLFTTVTNVSFDDQAIQELVQEVRVETARQWAAQNLSGTQDDQEYSLERVWTVDEDIKSLKSLLLFGVRGMAAYAYHAEVLGCDVNPLARFMFRALASVADDSLSMEDLLGLVMECGKANLDAMELLDRANTGAYGAPAPVTVPLRVEPGPFIVITGHDLHDLKLLLEQTEGTGVNVYTHGEMLPAQAYPGLKKYHHLKGNFGTAWQNQQKEFRSLPAPILFTTNCLMPPKPSYADRVYTTAVVGYPEIVHIGDDKDFGPIIARALELGGYDQAQERTGINGGTEVMTGFAHGAVLAAADTVVQAVKDGAITHFFLVGGCDGAKPGRNYYTRFVQDSPDDTVILTLACGKYRFNDLDLGEIAGLPRIMDMGQCNDAYSAIKVAMALAEAFECGVNDLPLTLVLSWYEQKAVAILLTLLHLGIRDILLGPTLPAFVSPNVWDYLVENFNIAATTTVKEDLARALAA
ncbi:MAG: hydroxylamine reductase [Propionibacteriaceae bacterium]|jgi:hydroxylamine reductase|nr:hydroxylamine reductase [Propionibacteriaceae bacterium]